MGIIEKTGLNFFDRVFSHLSNSFSSPFVRRFTGSLSIITFIRVQIIYIYGIWVGGFGREI